MADTDACFTYVQRVPELQHALRIQQSPTCTKSVSTGILTQCDAKRGLLLLCSFGPGDTSDSKWPIYRNGSSPVDAGFTECTILITTQPWAKGALNRQWCRVDGHLKSHMLSDTMSASDECSGQLVTATVYTGNPREGNVLVSFDLSNTLLPSALGLGVNFS